MALRFYKHGQGKLSRGVAALTVGLLGAFGCYRLYLWLGGFKAFRDELQGLEGILGTDIQVNLALVCSVGALALLTTGVYLLSNNAKVADFLLDTEAELKKVSWPSRREVLKSSAVVMVVVALLGLYILLLDTVLAKLQEVWGHVINIIFGK